MASNKSKIRCASCATVNGPEAKFCQNCGQPLTRQCPHCGNSNTPDAKFCNQCGSSLTAGSVPAHEDRLASLQQALPQDLQHKMRVAQARLEGERKPVAVLFTDIVSSTSLAEALDPEEWREIVTGAHQLVSEPVYRYEGTIAQLLGDGVLAFFGAPITHEDDPLRAVRAGLEIQQAMLLYQHKIRQKTANFQMRVGIHTGLVVVGNIGNDLHMEYLAVGDAVNLAARLQSLASPGKVLISEKTFHSVSDLIDCRDLGMVTVKGKQDPVHIFQVEGIKSEASGKYAMHALSNAMVGRDMELANLQELTASVEAGMGRAALVVGEPGVGKSRLIMEWKASFESGENNLRWIEGHCLSYEQGNAYHLVVDLLHSLLGLSASPSEADTRQALQSLLKNLSQDGWLDVYAALGHLLSLKLEQDTLAHVQKLDPISLQAKYVNALKGLFQGLAAQKPLVILCEDLHWVDPSSAEILTRLLPLILEAPVFFCFPSRHEQDAPGWQLIVAARATLGAGLAEMYLKPLGESATGQMVSNLLGTRELPEEVTRLVLEKAEGNPLFVEEVIRTLIECGALVRTEGGWVASPELGTLEIPDNLKRLVLARIDRLADEPKHVLRIASVIGREFLVKILEQVYFSSPTSGHEKMATHLHTLEYASLVRMTLARPELRYLFYHAIIHEATYAAMLKSDRRTLHRAVAEALEKSYPDRLEDLAATLGFHYLKGDVSDKALFYLEVAAENARSKFANREAIELYSSAIEVINQVPGEGPHGVEYLGKRLKLYESLGDVYHLIGQHKKARQAYQAGLDCPEARDIILIVRFHRKIGNAWVLQHGWEEAMLAYQTAETILGSDREETEVDWWREWTQIQTDRMLLYYWKNQPQETNRLAVRVRPVLERYGSPVQKAGFYRGLVMANIRLERYRISEEILANMQAYLAVQQEVSNPSDLAFAYFLQGFIFLWHGDLDPAEQQMQTALKLARQIGDVTVESRCLTYLVVCWRMRGQVAEVQQIAAQSEETARKAGMPEYIGTARANLAWAAWRQGDLASAQTQGLAAMDQWGKIPAGHASCAFEWTALLPLMAVAAANHQPGQAIDYARAMLDPAKLRFPDLLERALESAIQSWENNPSEAALEDQLNQVFAYARQMRYL
jgi:class 3 adenylate cyclase/tetratricopeptide (TPR) repeat protein